MDLILIGILGACFGSFINVIIYRIPNNLSIISPRSFCPECKQSIPSYRNIPIISSDCPTGPREILMNGKLGELFTVEDYKGLYNKILNYVNNRKKLSKKSYKAKNFLYRFNPILNSEKYNRLISYYLNEKL